MLTRRQFPVGVVAPCSDRNVPQVSRSSFRANRLPIELLTDNSRLTAWTSLCSAPGPVVSRKHFAPLAVQVPGATVIDNSSSAYPHGPGFRAAGHPARSIPRTRRATCGIIANPNCTTAVTLMALAPLHRAFGVRRVFASSYQAVSGSGARAIAELRSAGRGVGGRTAEVDAGGLSASDCLQRPAAGGRFPAENGYTKEEMKMQNEGAAHLASLPSFRASVTCVRVPVYRAHSVAVSAEFARPVSLEAARAALAAAPGLEVVDDPANHQYPMPLHSAGRDDCAVGRLRLDCALDNGLAFWVSGDQLLRGAALNAVEIAELL